MERIALIFGDYVIYWRPLLMAAAAVVSALLFAAFYTGKGGSVLSCALTVPLVVVLGTAASRLVHWYCRFDSYPGFHEAMTDYSTGSYALVGVFAACFVTALLLRATFLNKRLGLMLDSMTLAGCAGIAVGRMASFFDTSCRGPILENIHQLPWVWPVVNPVSGVQENRLAVFAIQAMIAAGLFAVLTVYYLLPRKNRPLRDGDVTLIFLLVYGASQAVLDSLRYDSLFFRSNGFVSVVQVLGAIAVVFSTVWFSVRLVKNRGLRKQYLIFWVLILGFLGLAGYMEYFVQRHGSEAAKGYCIMSASMAAVVITVLILRAFIPGKKTTADNHAGRYLRKSAELHCEEDVK